MDFFPKIILVLVIFSSLSQARKSRLDLEIVEKNVSMSENTILARKTCCLGGYDHALLLEYMSGDVVWSKHNLFYKESTKNSDLPRVGDSYTAVPI